MAQRRDDLDRDGGLLRPVATLGAAPAAGEPGMSDNDYPALYELANLIAGQAQKRHRSLVRLELNTVVAGALIGAVAPLAGVPGRVVAGLTVVALVLAITVKWLTRRRRDQTRWLTARSLAERVKTATWLFMMRQEPFADDAGEQDGAAIAFARFVGQLRRSDHRLVIPPSHRDGGDRRISGRMRQIRARPLAERRDFYVEHRLRDQADWYAAKARQNRRLRRRWFGLSLTFQVATLLAAGARVAMPDMGFGVVGLLASITAAATAWSQLGRHDELEASYAGTSRDLATVIAAAESASTDAAVRRIVRNGEAAIGSENAAWVSQRGGGVRESAVAAGSPGGPAGARN